MIRTNKFNPFPKFFSNRTAGFVAGACLAIACSQENSLTPATPPESVDSTCCDKDGSVSQGVDTAGYDDSKINDANGMSSAASDALTGNNDGGLAPDTGLREDDAQLNNGLDGGLGDDGSIQSDAASDTSDSQIGDDGSIQSDATSETNDGQAGDATGPGGTTEDAGSGPTLAALFADTVMTRWPDPRNITGTSRGWDYNNGIVLRGIMEVYRKTGDARYLDYIKKYVDYFVDSNGDLYTDSAHTKRIQNESHSLDLIQPAILLLFILEENPSATKYQTAATLVRNMFSSFPANPEGGFWHKEKYPNEMWLDGIYMASPFLARYGAMNASCGSYCDSTPISQATLVAGHTALPSGLLLHAWDFDHNATWCTGSCTTTGLSPEVWSRGLGWYAMALVDILAYLPSNDAGRASLISRLNGIAQGAKDAQDPATGMWCQVVTKCNLSDNWTESSGSSMLVYSLKKAADAGYIDDSYRAVAQVGWSGLKSYKVGSDWIGPTIKDAATGMSAQSNYSAYVNADRMTNSYHGLCAIMLAAAAMEY